MADTVLQQEFAAIIQSLVHRGKSQEDIEEAFAAAMERQFPSDTKKKS